jgi:hypothetical protein
VSTDGCECPTAILSPLIMVLRKSNNWDSKSSQLIGLDYTHSQTPFALMHEVPHPVVRIPFGPVLTAALQSRQAGVTESDRQHGKLTFSSGRLPEGLKVGLNQVEEEDDMSYI